MKLRFFTKELFDYLVLVITMPFWIVLLTIVAIAMKIKEPNFPVFFIQKRIGKDGKPFNMIKFRSMIPNVSENTITSKNDARITKLGSFLRKWKLDELPELINILKGEMSLVGPRPDVPGYADKLQGEDKLILSLKPGITGPASLKYANEEELLASVEEPKWYNDHIIFPDKVKINLNYYYHHSIVTDIKLIFRTLFIKTGKSKSEAN
ncbi:MAG: sugar transferase [Ginsengibacter sp.]